MVELLEEVCFEAINFREELGVLGRLVLVDIGDLFDDVVELVGELARANL